MIRVASIPGPPCSIAVTLTARKALVLPMTRMYPAPMRPTLRAWIAVVRPLIRSAANTAHERYAALPPASVIMIIGVSTMLAMQSMAYCTPSPTVIGSGGRSSGW